MTFEMGGGKYLRLSRLLLGLIFAIGNGCNQVLIEVYKKWCLSDEKREEKQMTRFDSRYFFVISWQCIINRL